MATNAELRAVLKLKDEFSGRLGKIEKSVGKFSKKQAAATKGTAGFGKGVGDLVSKFTPFNAGMLGAAGAVAAVGGAMVKAVGDTIALGSQLVDLSSKTGLSVTALQEIRFAGEQAGVGFDQMTSAVQRLGRRTAAELPETTKFLGAMGLTIDDIVSKKPEDAFALVAEKIASIENPAQQAAAAMGVFGDAGLQVLPAINQGLQENIERFRELGVAMDEDTAQAAKRMGDTLTDLKARFEGVKITIGSALLPALENLLIFFGDLLPGVMQKAAAIFTRHIARMVDGIELLLRAGALIHPGMQTAADSISNFGNSLRDMASEQDAAAKANFIHANGLPKLTDNTNAATISTADFSTALGTTGTAALDLSKDIEILSDQTFYLQEILPEVSGRIAVTTGEINDLQLVLPGVAKGMKDTGDETKVATEFTDSYGGALNEAAGLMSALGVETDSTLGKTLAFGQQAVSVFDSILGLIDSIGGGLGGIGGALSGLFGGGGGGGGGGVGGGLGGLLGGLGGGGLGALAGLGIAGGTALVGAIAGIGGRDAGNVQEEAGRDLGITISDGLAEAIHETEKNIQLFLRDIFAEGNLGLDRLAEETGDIFAVLATGDVNRADAVKALDETIPILIANFESLGEEGLAQIDRILDAAANSGVSSDALDELAARRAGTGGAPAQAGSSAGAGGGAGSDGLMLEELKLIRTEVDENGVPLESLPMIREELRQLRLATEALPRTFARAVRDELGK